MPEALNHQWEMTKLRNEIAERQSRGENTDVLEASLRLIETWKGKTAAAFIEKTMPKGD